MRRSGDKNRIIPPRQQRAMHRKKLAVPVKNRKGSVCLGGAKHGRHISVFGRGIGLAALKPPAAIMRGDLHAKSFRGIRPDAQVPISEHLPRTLNKRRIIAAKLKPQRPLLPINLVPVDIALHISFF